MTGMKKWMLGAAMLVGAAALGVPSANAARIGVGVYVGAPAAYAPPCPGPGYAWVDGYYANGYWVPGYWNFVGVSIGRPFFRGGVVVDRGPVVRQDFDRHFDRDNHFRR